MPNGIMQINFSTDGTTSGTKINDATTGHFVRGVTSFRIEGTAATGIIMCTLTIIDAPISADGRIILDPPGSQIPVKKVQAMIVSGRVCNHEWVSVGFMSGKMACKKCNADKP